MCFQTRNRFKDAVLTGLRTSGKVSQRGNTMGRTIRNVTCLRGLEGQPRLRGWSSSSSPVSAVCCGERETHTTLNDDHAHRLGEPEHRAGWRRCAASGGFLAHASSLLHAFLRFVREPHLPQSESEGQTIPGPAMRSSEIPLPASPITL